jgi:shikimate dehydrogenase
VRRAVLLAHPAGHSLSPVLHDAAFVAVGLDARYEAWDVPPSDLPNALARLRGDPTALGGNVSVPHKAAVVPLLDEVRPDAGAIGAVNVLVRQGDRWIGDSSDGSGFLRSLDEAGVDPAGRAVALIGAGGAARAVCWALARTGVRRVAIVNRTPDRARALARLLRTARIGLPVDVAPDARGLTGIDLFVQATSLGMRRGGVDPDETPVDAATLAAASGGSDPVAVDLVYRPRRTPFLAAAEAAGLRSVDGVGMLLHQGAEAFEAWTGVTAPLAVMRDALEAALAAEVGS